MRLMTLIYILVTIWGAFVSWRLLMDRMTDHALIGVAITFLMAMRTLDELGS
jgi:hypothetical protein